VNMIIVKFLLLSLAFVTSLTACGLPIHEKMNQSSRQEQVESELRRTLALNKVGIVKDKIRLKIAWTDEGTFNRAWRNFEKVECLSYDDNSNTYAWLANNEESCSSK
jgi:hypothetical protein